MRVFNMESGVMRGLTKFTDLICLSILFVITSIPVFTIGTSCTALYYTVYKVIRHDRGYIFREYMSAFKDNFKQTTPLWLLVAVLFGLIMGDVYVMDLFSKAGNKVGILPAFFLAGLILVFAWSLYLFPYMARFENTRKNSMKNAALMAIASFPWTVVMVIMGVIASFILYILPVSVVLVPGIFTYIQTNILEKVFWKYMSEEDRAAEEERNREFKN